MIPFPDKKYKVIYADPAWRYDNEKTGGDMESGASQKYLTMSLEDILNLPIRDIIAKDSVCFLWATVPLMPEAFTVLKAWGFTYKTMITWRKIMSQGLGYWFRGQCEHLLLGIRGNVRAFHCQRPNFMQISVQDHSQKPHQFRRLIEQVTKDMEPKIELFARQKAYGWDAWGNEVEDLPTLESYTL